MSSCRKSNKFEGVGDLVHIRRIPYHGNVSAWQHVGIRWFGAWQALGYQRASLSRFPNAACARGFGFRLICIMNGIADCSEPTGCNVFSATTIDKFLLVEVPHDPIAHNFFALYRVAYPSLLKLFPLFNRSPILLLLPSHSLSPWPPIF